LVTIPPPASLGERIAAHCQRLYIELCTYGWVGRPARKKSRS